MINHDTIISVYEDKLTLMQWLRKVEEALKGASATSFSVNKKGNATISFQINFDDGTSLESGDIVLQQGESVASAAIVNGHLILTLTNGDELDAGSVGAVSGFSIDASQHLIVTYQDGTSFDLGAIFNGNVNISGVLSVTGNSSVSGDLSVVGKINGGEIVETMTGYRAEARQPSNGTNTPLYYGVCKNGNKITFVACGILTRTSGGGWRDMARFDVPAAINDKLVPFYGTRFDVRHIALFSGYDQELPQSIETNMMFSKGSGVNPALYISIDMAPLVMDTPYFYRIECTYLLSDDLIQ